MFLFEYINGPLCYFDWEEILKSTDFPLMGYGLYPASCPIHYFM